MNPMNPMPGIPLEPDVEKVVEDVMTALAGMIKSHDDCEWQQVGPCVYCVDHNLRLYQGSLPSDRRPACDEHDWDYEQGMGFYFICKTCGEREWPE